jgi:hypothetical protein
MQHLAILSTPLQNSFFVWAKGPFLLFVLQCGLLFSSCLLNPSSLPTLLTPVPSFLAHSSLDLEGSYCSRFFMIWLLTFLKGPSPPFCLQFCPSHLLSVLSLLVFPHCSPLTTMLLTLCSCSLSIFPHSCAPWVGHQWICVSVCRHLGGKGCLGREKNAAVSVGWQEGSVYGRNFKDFGVWYMKFKWGGCCR